MNKTGATRRVETAALMDSMGLKSMRDQFKQGQKFKWKFWTWHSTRNGVHIGSICDNIMTDQRRIFKNCQIKIPRFNTDHYALMGVITTDTERSHRRYVQRRQTYPIKKLKVEAMNQADSILDELEKAASKKEKSNTRISSWITMPTWKLIDQRVSYRGCGNMEMAKEMKGPIRRALRADRANRCLKVGEAIGALLERAKSERLALP